MQKKKPNLQDVARAAKVSLSTVSRVINGTSPVSPAVRQRVGNAAAKLDLDLRKGKTTNAIGFILGNRPMLHYFHGRILAGAYSYCSERDYLTVLLSVNYPASVPWNKLHLPQILQRRDLVDGFIVAGTNSQNLLDLLSHTGLPFSVLGNNVLGDWRRNDYDVVWLDDTEGAYQLTRSLQARGHRDIFYIGNRALPWFARRYDGYRRAMVEADLTPRSSRLTLEGERDLGYLATKSILSGAEPVTAIFAGGDSIASGVYEALHEYTMKVPDDMSVAGFNDIETAGFHPPLTTVRTFPEQLGAALAEFVISRGKNPDVPRQETTVPTQLIRRESDRALAGAPAFQDSPKPDRSDNANPY